nr:unnamed protein product [Naegleria fowleri]
MLTSLPFQLVVLSNTVWSYFVVIVSFITLIVKGSILLYPSYALALEFIGWICYAVITFANLRLNSLGNFTENYTPIFLSLPFLTLMLGGTIYYLFLQVYVRKETKELISHFMRMQPQNRAQPFVNVRKVYHVASILDTDINIDFELSLINIIGYNTVIIDEHIC